MSIRFAINGVGRIGRALIRVASQRPGLELVAINDLASPDQLAPLLAHDSLHGDFPGQVARDADGELTLEGRRVATFQEPEAEKITWLDLAPTIVVDATGMAKTRQKAGRLRRGSVEKVIVSANAEDLDLTLCLGINNASYDPESHHLLSAASCTTNCLAPMIHVLDRKFGLEHGLFNTVHSYNNDQRLLSYPHADPRRARAAALNMIPTTTSASQAIHRVLPGFAGKLDGFAVRVPTPNVSLIDLVATLAEKPTPTEINDAFLHAASEDLVGILSVTEEMLVSMDFLGDPHSAIVDLPLTAEVDRRLYRVVAWYDNEWGHANRLADLIELIGGEP
jgi:glyceraldehyde 3-phosphate dehydrogenase